MKKSFVLSWIAVAGALLPALVAGGLAVAQEAESPLEGSSENTISPTVEAYERYSTDGDFRVVWPSGCGSLTTRTLGDGYADVDVFESEYPVGVHCNRAGKEGAGCMVVVVYNGKTADGSPAGPPEVVSRMTRQLQEYGAALVRQRPLVLQFAGGITAEGLEIHGAQQGGAGQVWLRGFLIGSDIYLLSAWDLEGGVWEDPEYHTFFNSFRLGAE